MSETIIEHEAVEERAVESAKAAVSDEQLIGCWSTAPVPTGAVDRGGRAVATADEASAGVRPWRARSPITSAMTSATRPEGAAATPLPVVR
jgi:hypothetical protein